MGTPHILRMSIPRFSAMISARKSLKQEKKEESEKEINAETFGQITNQTENYSERENNFSGKIIQAETFGDITNNTNSNNMDNYNNESGKTRNVFGAGNLSDILRVWPEGNFQDQNKNNNNCQAL